MNRAMTSVMPAGATNVTPRLESDTLSYRTGVVFNLQVEDLGTGECRLSLAVSAPDCGEDHYAFEPNIKYERIPTDGVNATIVCGIGGPLSSAGERMLARQLANLVGRGARAQLSASDSAEEGIAGPDRALIFTLKIDDYEGHIFLAWGSYANRYFELPDD